MLANRHSNSPTAAQQGAAPDRLQLRSFLTPLSAAGELGVLAKRAAWLKPFCLGGVAVPAFVFLANVSRRRFRVSGVSAFARRLGFCGFGVSVLVRRLGFVWRERFGFAASTCGRNYCGAKCVTSPEQGAAPDR